MKEFKDTYKTINKTFKSEVYKIKGSRFIGYAFPVKTEKDIEGSIKKVKEEHYKARHWCYAWQLGTEKDIKFRVNDDREPSNSAGQPIYGQISSFNLTNILIIVVRYFGGTKLGVGGLISAYKTTAKMVLEKSEVIQKTNNITFNIIFEYKDMDKILRALKNSDALILERKMELKCKFKVSVRKKNNQYLKQRLIDLRIVKFCN